MPAAYYDTGCDIIPLRIAYSTHFALTVFSYIDDWIWFKTPIVATKEIYVTLDIIGEDAQLRKK